jgi:hypothetical protein
VQGTEQGESEKELFILFLEVQFSCKPGEVHDFVEVFWGEGEQNLLPMEGQKSGCMASSTVI